MNELEPTGRRRAALFVALAYAVATVVLTWPLAVPTGAAVSARPDYFMNLWNLWWVERSVLAGTTPFWTDLLHHPEGVSLARHTLSLGNSIPGALLSRVVGLEAAYSLLLALHYWLSACTGYALAARVTGSRTGGFLAGLLWAFSPFHAHYLAQINVATLELLPLVVLALLEVRRAATPRSVGLAVFAFAALAATSWYYLVYAALLGGLLALFGFLEDREPPFVRAALRLALTAAVAALPVAAIAWPLLSEAAGAPPGPDVSVEDYGDRSNDLVGFRWVGPPEVGLVSWPTMLGWSALAIVLLGARGWRGRGLWWLLAALFFVLSLGPRLTVGGSDTGVALPYAWLESLPVLSMLRKPDRFALLVQLAWIVIVASSWRALAASLSERVRRPAFVVVALVVALELGPGPLATFETRVPPEVAQLAQEEGAVCHLPTRVGHGADTLANLWQTAHGRPVPQGYVTSLALSESARDRGHALEQHLETLEAGRARPLVDFLRARGVGTIILHVATFQKRDRLGFDGETVWRPFAFAKRELVFARQAGPYELVPRPREHLTRRTALVEVLGTPFLETADFTAFRLDG